jgi:hypothetical protein
LANAVKNPRSARVVLAVVTLFLAAQTYLVIFGPMTVNDEIECGSLHRPEKSLTGTDASLCRKALAEQRVWAAGASAVGALALVGFFLVPRR